MEGKAQRLLVVGILLDVVVQSLGGVPRSEKKKRRQVEELSMTAMRMQQQQEQ